MSKITRDNITEHLIKYQLEMVGKTWEEAKATPFWFSEFTMTTEQHKTFKGYAIPLLRKVFKINKKKAEDTFKWFNFQYGLKIYDYEKKDD